MSSDIAATPLLAIDSTRITGQIGEMVPVITMTADVPGIAPIIITDTIWREMHVATFGLTWVFLIIANKAVKKTGFAPAVVKYFAQD